MIIRTKLSKEEYKSACLAIIWSKNTFKIFAAIFLLVTLVNIFTSRDPVVGILPAIVPVIIIGGLMYFVFGFSLSKAYKNNPRISEQLEYQLSNSGIIIIGETFKSELNWEKFHKVTATKKWLLLWHSSQLANAIPINLVSAEMLSDLKKIVNDHHVKNNL